MVQPAHQRGVPAGHLHSVDAEIEAVGAFGFRRRAARDDQGPGDQRRRLAGPAGLDRQAAEVDGVALQHDLLARRCADGFRLHRQHPARQRDHLQGFAETARRFRLAQESEHFADLTQLLRRPANGLGHPLDGAEQVDQHGHVPGAVAILRLFEQDRRPAFQKRGAVDARHLQVRGDRPGFAPKLAVPLQLSEEIAQGGVGRRGAQDRGSRFESVNRMGSRTKEHAGHMAQSRRKDKRAQPARRFLCQPVRTRSYKSFAPGIRSFRSPLRDRMRL